jgi:hypothetical protein
VLLPTRTAYARPRSPISLLRMTILAHAIFRAGFVLIGQQTVPLGDRLWAVSPAGPWA